MKSLFRRNRKGVSTVIATIIIVAISIVMAIAVAYWVLGIGGSFTRFEKIEFTSAYADSNSTGSAGGYLIHMTIKNTGSASATIDPATIFYNGKPASAYPNFQPSTTLGGQYAMDPGNSTDRIIYLPLFNATAPSGAQCPWASSMNLEVMIQTTAGRQYPKVVTLP